MGDSARGNASNAFIETFGYAIELAQSGTDGSIVDMNDSLQVVYAIQTSRRRYVSDNVIFEPDADDDSNLEALLVALRLEPGTSGFKAKRRAVIKKMKKADLISSTYQEA